MQSTYRDNYNIFSLDMSDQISCLSDNNEVWSDRLSDQRITLKDCIVSVWWTVKVMMMSIIFLHDLNQINEKNTYTCLGSMFLD